MGALRVYIGDSRDLSVLPDSSVDLVVTSPPYWHIKDYGIGDQIGHGQDLHSYLGDLFLVWRECVRVLSEGRRICVNIGDQFARSSVYGRYRVIPLHAEIISQMELLGMDYMGSIIWNKRTTMNTTGGAVIMGSYPYPPNGIVEIDYEFIMIFRKPGRSKKLPKDIKEASRLSKEEWKALHTGHWNFKGARQVSHEAMFPLELPSRLVRMFSFRGETVLDPFLGSGTTLEAARDLGRSGVGFELNREFLPLIRERFGDGELEIMELKEQNLPEDRALYVPVISNAKPPEAGDPERTLFRVKDISGDASLILNDGRRITLGGIDIVDIPGALEYLNARVRGKEVSVEEAEGANGHLVFLRNRIYVNGELVKMGCASVLEGSFPARKRLERIRDRARK